MAQDAAWHGGEQPPPRNFGVAQRPISKLVTHENQLAGRSIVNRDREIALQMLDTILLPTIPGVEKQVRIRMGLSTDVQRRCQLVAIVQAQVGNQQPSFADQWLLVE